MEIINFTTQHLHGGVVGKEVIALVGDAGTILTSKDATTFQKKESGTTSNLYGIVYGNNILVAVGDSGTILASDDGTTWHKRTSGVTDNLFKIAYGNSTFVATGASGVTLISSEGITRQRQNPQNTFNNIAFGSSTFVAVDRTTSAIFSSCDGINWQKKISGTVNSLEAVAFLNNTFVIVGASGTILQSDFPPINIYSIPLSIGWNLISLPLMPSITTLSSVNNSISTNYEIIWGDYNDSTGSWKYYKPGIYIPSGSKLTTMSPGKGYWIKMKEQGEWK